MPKKQLIIVIIVILVVAIIFLSVLVFNNRPRPESIITKPSPSPSQTTVAPSVFIPQDLQQEKIEQENYAQSRAEYLNSHPWVLKMPLKSANYFISYDSEKEEFLVTLYSWDSSSLSKEEQLAQSREEALKALTDLGLDVEQIKIVYNEIAKN